MRGISTDYRKLFEVNDILYKINRNKMEGPFKTIITKVEQGGLGHYIYHCDAHPDSFFNSAVGRTYFISKEEAQAELLKIKKANKKRNLLKEYERKLNKELDLENHIIIK